MGRPVQVAKRRRPRRVRLSMPYRGDPLAVKAPAHTNVEKRERGDPAFRPAGQQRLNARERVFADLALAMLRNIPPGAIERYAVDQDDGALAMATALAVAPYEPLIAEALLEQFDESGVNASDEWRREISRAWARVGKADVPKKPSTVALEYRFDRASPTATKWATNEAASLVTDITYQQSKAMREVVTRAFTEGRTYGQTASALGQILQQVNPTGDVGQMLASQYAINANGLTPMYANAVARSAQGHAEALLAQGVTGTKALEAVQKKGQRYADKLRRSRAKMISRTEIMRASNQGRLEAANQAAKKGLIDPAAAMRQWMASPMDACPICTDLNGAIVALNQSWYAGEPPAHPSCRCTWLLVPNVNVQAPPMFGGAGTGDSPFKWSFPAPMKVGDDFLPGAPLVEPVPSTVPSAHDAMKESLLGQLEDGLVTVDEVVEAQLAQAGNDAFLAGKNPVSVLEDALVTLDDGTVVMNLGRVMDLDSLPAVEAMPYRMLILPPRLASLVDAPSPSWKPWEPLLHAVKNDYVKRGYLDVDTADEIAAAIRTLRDAALGKGITSGALQATDLLDFWRALARLSDNLDNRVRAAIKAGAKPPQGGSTLAKWLKRQAKIVNTLNAADDTAAAFATALEGEIVSWFGAGTDWVLPKVKITGPRTAAAVAEPGWWAQEMTPGQKWSVGLQSDDPATSLAQKFGKWDDLSDGTKKLLASATEDEHIKNLVTHLESTGVLPAGGGPPPSIFATVAEPPWWKGLDLDKDYGLKWDALPPQVQQALDAYGPQIQQFVPDSVFADVASFVDDLVQAVEAGGVTSYGPVGTVLDEGTAAVADKFTHYFSIYENTVDDLGKWRTALFDEAAGSTAVGRARLSNLWGTSIADTPGIYDNLVLPLGMRGLDAKDFATARVAIKNLVDKDLLTAANADKFTHALQLLEDAAKFMDNWDAAGRAEALVDLLQGIVKWNAQLQEHLSLWTGSVGVEALGKGTRVRKWYDAFTDSLKLHTDDIDNIKISQHGPVGTVFDDILPWLDEADLAELTPVVAPAPPSAATPKKPPPVEAQPLTDWKKPSMPDEPPFDPKRLIEDTGATASLGGQHPKRVFTDPDTGQQWIFKPQAQWQAEADRATAELQRRLGLQGAETYVVKVDGQIGSIQQALGGTLADTAPIFGGKAFDATMLSSAQMGRMQQNQLLDFLFSNYDAHSDNFLRLRTAVDPAMLPIGIDKGQAFKPASRANPTAW